MFKLKWISRYTTTIRSESYDDLTDALIDFLCEVSINNAATLKFVPKKEKK